jgi:hypothetical protein
VVPSDRKGQYESKRYLRIDVSLSLSTCKSVIGEHGQRFLVSLPGVIGERNPCPYVSVSSPLKTYL